MENKFKEIVQSDLDFFVETLGKEAIFIDSESLSVYGRDYTEDLFYSPEVVLKPSTKEEISVILKYCNENNIAITPRGAGTSLSGGALPVFGGVCLSLEKMNRILLIDENNLQAIVQPGVINQHLQEAVEEKGLFYPPDPASKGSCFLGGNIAHSSGGPRAVKYGTTKDYVLNLEVVLPSGEIINTGANTLKNSTGYNLTQLFVGSEGTLGIVTQITFRLIPKPKHNLLMLAAFNDANKACEAVAAIFHKGITPSALEFMERDAIDYTIKYTGVSFEVPDWVEAHLIVEVDGNYPEILQQDCAVINDVLEAHGCGDVLFAESETEKNTLWALRRKVGEAVKSFSIYKEEDTVVSRANLPALLKGVKEIGNKYGFKSVCYGHAGDGNLHVNILKGELSDDFWNDGIKEAIKEIFILCKELGGTISGEHGIGYVQKEYMPLLFSDTHLDLFRNLKKVFDPKGILNPGKMV